MVGDRSGRAGARLWELTRIVAGAAGLALAVALGGCSTEAEYGGRGATVAFESVDGPPRTVFDLLVTRLDAAARAQQVAVVSRRSPARYRVRMYLAAKLERRSTAIAWVMDVYDSDLRRAARISGEEPAGGHRTDAWEAADDQVLARIAAAGMARLAEIAAGAGTAPLVEPPAAAPERAVPEPDIAPAGNIRVAAAPQAMAAAVVRAR
jgi:hypothetical protein